MSATDAIVRLTEESLAEKIKERDEKVGPLVTEIKDLEAALKKLTRGSGSGPSAPTVAEDDLLAAVAHVSKEGPASSKDIAKFLGTDTRNIARRLSSFASDGKISGDKDTGYSVA